MITAAKSSTQKTGNARNQVCLPAGTPYDSNFIKGSGFECSEFFMLRTAPTEHNVSPLGAFWQCVHPSTA